MTDQELVTNILQGEQQAFKELTVRYQSLVINTCYKVLKDHDDAMDIAQEVFLEAYNSMAQLRQTESVSFWLYRVAFNKSINYTSKLKYRRKCDQIDPSTGNQASEGGETPQSTLEREEAQRILHCALNKLPERQRKCFVLHKVEGYSHNKISEITDYSISTIESLLFRAKKNLRKYLSDYYNTNY